MFVLLQTVSGIKDMKLSKMVFVPIIAVASVMFLMNAHHSRIIRMAEKEGIKVVRSISIDALSSLFQNPIFGPGEASFVKAYGQAPHNTLISVGLEYGIIGMVLLLIVIAYSFYNLWRNREKRSLVYFFPLLSLVAILSSFSGIGHKLLWFYLVAAAIFHERSFYDDETNLASHSE
jgi:hypothetical protein